MILYHGSTVVVPKPDVIHSRQRVDFGKGFYTTPLLDQACRWSERFIRLGQPGVVSRYAFDEEALKIGKVLSFTSYSEEWLDFIISCRRGQDTTDYDIVIGGVANDRVFNTIELFISNLATKEDTIRRLRYEEPNLQICFRTQLVIEKYLRFEGCEQL